MIENGLAFDDVLLVPQYSDISSRSLVSLDVSLGGLRLKNPLVPANMASIATRELLGEQVRCGGLALIHRFQSIEDQVDQFEVLVSWGEQAVVGASVGVKREDFDRVKTLGLAGCHIFCVDVAHADSYLAEQMVRFLKNEVGTKPTIIAGNVATRSGARRLFEAGADIVKVGVGPGSLCTTRIETGCGVPQLTALMNIAEIRSEFFPDHGLIADGGIKNAGDCVKALCFADAIMCGNLFAGCDETGTGIYRGSSTHKTSHIEGVVASVRPKGPYHKVLDRLLDGIRSGCSYQGAHNLAKLKEDPQLIRITSAGLRESYPHDVVVVPDEG